MKITPQYAWPIWLVLWMMPALLPANNIKVSELTLTNTNLANQYTQVSFDLSWENSWRLSFGAANWDAAWVFVKFRSFNGPWQHATLNYVNGSASSDGHTQPSGAIINTVPDAKGVFIYRDADGTGDVDWQGVQLRWNYGLDGLSSNSMLEVKVFAIEMVYVPQGPYPLGGGNGTETGKIYQFAGLGQDNPYPITSENAIAVGINAGNLFYNAPASANAGDQLGPIPAAFPKGYESFYCMKYEVSQQQWIDFFNLLTPIQQTNNDLTDLAHRGPNAIDRNEIQWKGTGGATTANPDVPVSFPLWGEVLAYCDWAGLRPMTELEFVKACRGPQAPVANAYAWGSTNIINASLDYNLSFEGAANEIISNPVSNTGNANWINSSTFDDGPYRCGIFAASNTPQREDVGASYYGIMEMSGNLSEMVISIGTPAGRSFQGTHGDGALDSAGEADASTWPPITGEGGGLMGGSWFSAPEQLQINDRAAATQGNLGYFNDVGFRCVRTAP
ncbi:MAG: SUMF1/EgtB/PvdO family nonheme iron enzyme [Bacteroidota bacterium]